MVECRKKENSANCPCTYSVCGKKGICCECLKFHIDHRELPACCFPADVEKTYDRSFETFAKLVALKKI